MTVSVDVGDRFLLEMLFVRSAWDLAADLPEVDPAPAQGSSRLPAQASAEAWSERWREAWHRDWDVLRNEPRGVRAPSWRAQFGADGLDEAALERWITDRTPVSLPPLDEEPERQVVPALRKAWEAGLESVVVLPLRGDWSWTASPRCLVVSDATRGDNGLYAAALGRFARGRIAE
ncbi:hypothetical protein [Microbacterium sp. KR10-403]|uniref:hypothetical protein n=1 Tax=Microbacterium sp. KR10-403 TaxID=3158581 RepID=UPI0032E4DAFA